MNPLPRMSPQEFYQGLRDTDQYRVPSLVRRLHKEGFRVYACGSSLQDKAYYDIDLVVTPQTMGAKAELLKLNYAREKLDRAVLSFLEHTIKAECRGLTGKAVVQSEYHFPVGEESPTYAYSGVSERRKIDIQGTSIDIVLTAIPFLHDPDAPKVKLC